ncbi:MAG: hypothetical protein WAW96_06565 [Alphaproteobacteria bacterium]
MANIALPFSGSVTQAINPWNIFLRSMTEVGLININIGKGDPAIEQDALEEVGSYGRQIGRMADVMEILIGTLDEQNITEQQRKAIYAFKEMLDGVRAVKAKKRDGKSDESLLTPPAKLAREALPPAPLKSVAS